MDVTHLSHYRMDVPAPRQPVSTEWPPLELVNSLAPGGEDLLRDRGWLRAAAVRWGLPDGAAGRLDLDALASLRALLTELTARVAAGRPFSDGQLEALNAVIGSIPIRAQLVTGTHGRYLVEMRPQTEDPTELAVRDLAGGWVSLLRRSHPPRLKVCANDACRRAFYDASRNRSRRWCDGARCGNRERVRRHRAAR